MCREGYLRTSSEDFDIKKEEIQNRFIHLTNNAVQKYGEKYGSFESGNQLSFKAFEVPCFRKLELRVLGIFEFPSGKS